MTMLMYATGVRAERKLAHMSTTTICDCRLGRTRFFAHKLHVQASFGAFLTWTISILVYALRAALTHLPPHVPEMCKACLRGLGSRRPLLYIWSTSVEPCHAPRSVTEKDHDPYTEIPSRPVSPFA